MEYIEKTKEEGCVFCMAQQMEDSAENLIAFRGERAYVILNRYPYTSGHLMVVPFDHQAHLEDLDASTRAEMMELTTRCITILRQLYHPEAFNMGANIGESAGAGVKSHVHIHVVPRWQGDTNFMTVLGETRVLPEALERTYERVRNGFLEGLRLPWGRRRPIRFLYPDDTKPFPPKPTRTGAFVAPLTPL